ncbi:MAG: NUDIX domain-containing protein [Zetaproteobacteria bacterium]|nr:MAG: NUDIX domain-containing protein [Zetaproteobacteria bacterium]
MEYRIVGRKVLHRGFLHVEAITVEHDKMDGGCQRITREHVERGDAVAVVLYDACRDEVLLLEQFRIGPVARGENPWLIEIVAGVVAPDEGLVEAARRECVEEAGYEPQRLLPLGYYYATPGGSSERIHLFLGEVERGKPCGRGGGCLEEQEDIRTFWVAREEAMNLLDQGRIHSGAPMLGLLLAFGCRGRVDSVGVGVEDQ